MEGSAARDALGDCLRERLGLERLGDVPSEALALGSLGVLRPRVGGQGDRGRARDGPRHAPELTDKVIAVAVRHGDVADQHVRSE